MATRMMVEHAALHSRGLERCLKNALLVSRGAWDLKCFSLTTEAVEDLVWWIDLLCSPTQCAMWLTPHDVTIDTDASPWGFGAFLGCLATGGFWGPTERAFSQNGRELRAVELALRHS